MSEQEKVIEIRYREYSFLAMLRILIFCFFVAYLVNTLSYGLVGFTHLLDDIITVTEYAVEASQYVYHIIK